MITEHARPKVNLTLEVLGRRDDGYHLLQSLVVFPDSGDLLEISASDQLTFIVEGPFAEGLPTDSNNLVVKIADYLQTEFNISDGAELKLIKNLPVASGVGGGSADAAAALRGLNRLWKLNLSDLDLEAIGLQFGADIPVCIRSQSRFMEGIGEALSLPTLLSDFAILLVNPGVSVSTPSIFKKLNYPAGHSTAAVALPRTLIGMDILQDYVEGHRNDLQEPAIILAPEIANVLACLSATMGCLFHRMSGSGATCFGLYRTLSEARDAANEVSASHPDWWVSAALVNGVR